MYQQTPIICPFCKTDTGYKVEQFQNFYLSYDVKCPYCQQVIIHANKAVCSSQAFGAESEE